MICLRLFALICGGILIGCGGGSESREASAPWRRFDESEQRALKEKLGSIRFPCLKEDLWRELGVEKAALKPWFHSLTTGTFWERYQLDDDTFLVLRTLADDRPEVGRWCDGAVVSRIPDKPWNDRSP